jgi:hypothetical protein
MVEFLKCEAGKCPEDGAEDRQNKLIERLNDKFGSMYCLCHPEYKWKIAVDLTEDCKYKFHHASGYEHEPECGFRERLVKNEVMAFLAE